MSTIAHQQSAQLSLPIVIDLAEETARRLIRPYVQRGDDPEWIKSGGMGIYGSALAVSIGGYCGKKKFSTDYIVVNRDLNGVECDQVFSFWKLYEAERNLLSQAAS